MKKKLSILFEDNYNMVRCSIIVEEHEVHQIIEYLKLKGHNVREYQVENISDKHDKLFNACNDLMHYAMIGKEELY